MAFEGLSERLQSVMRKLRGKGKVTEADLKEAMREVRLALLEADVNFKVVKSFIDRVKERAIGQEVLKSLTPGQQVIKVVNEELTALMGGEQSKLVQSAKPPTKIMMVGLQGAGKTTTSGKLVRYLQKQNRRALLVAADVYRPAAIRQLEILGADLNTPVFSLGDKEDPVVIAQRGVAKAKEENLDYVIIDTAGRLHVDQEMMDELKRIREQVEPDEILLVVDAMTGQDAVNVAETFHSELGLTGVVLTKLDGDTRGGAALSVKAVTQCPIKFVGLGEKTDALEPFYPDRMASRILGMGDVLTLIEKAQAAVDAEKAKELERKMRTLSFTFDDFLDQLQQVRKMGPLEDMLAMLPGAGQIKGLKNLQVDEKQLSRVEAIIRSMTPQEKENPEIINASRRKRIANGSGTTVQDVNRLLKQFNDMKKMMKQFSQMSKGGKRKKRGFRFPFMQ
ncbi:MULTISPECIES: signal recognition particle protein [unclassified Thermoactinomyces]|jgi:signal recognition particle subunit SRP54|uniref:signal recognition particle protein n=1 Tax=unclassified Thermoactinomyces TaxID=2634588 RepID=UPI0018DDC9D2|nr:MULTISPECIES: signal recognition particle protein [unclassified Thermoactinomyces]MBH8598160.1 signal recognition particle protein [Thermoactinomyces sp. CICC 10523]MBH8603191.1 signal recognition particle protein [Thermoactinomyces sp. CICC 10522]MBH8607002.1 signal recognition particle protein [Thermoactinomyces sp. CICC 10521]